MRPRGKLAVFASVAVAVCLVLPLVRADSWVAPSPVGYLSPDEEFWMEIYPAGKRYAGRWRARAFFYRVNRTSEGLAFEKLWARDLEYGGAFDWEERTLLPDVFVLPRGRGVVMLWQHSNTRGDVNDAVVVYAGDGKLLKKYDLSDLLTREFIREAFWQTISFLHWRRGSQSYYSHDGSVFAVQLGSGKRVDAGDGAAAVSDSPGPRLRLLSFDMKTGAFSLGKGRPPADYVLFADEASRTVALGSDTVTDRVKHAGGGSVHLTQPPWMKE